MYVFGTSADLCMVIFKISFHEIDSLSFVEAKGMKGKVILNSSSNELKSNQGNC